MNKMTLCALAVSAVLMSGCDERIDEGTTDSGVSTDVSDTNTYASDEFTLISSQGVTSDIDFASDTVGEWSTGSQISEDTYAGVNGWKVASGTDTAENGNWGSVLVFQSGISGDFSNHTNLKLSIATTGGYDDGYRVAISANGVSKEITLAVDDSDTSWQDLDISLNKFALELSSIDYIAVMAVGGTPGVSAFYITDLALTKEYDLQIDSSVSSDFVFRSSDSSIETDLVVDGDDNSSTGNVIFGEWSTNTSITDSSFDNLYCWQLDAGDGWGSVLTFQGDISDGSTIDNFDVDLSNYTNLKLKVASSGGYDRYAVSIVAKDGDTEASHEVSFSLEDESEWNEININLESFDIDLSNVNQLAVFGVHSADTSGQSLYITDMIAYDTGISWDEGLDSSDDKFVFITSGSDTVDLNVDGNDYANTGNVVISEWSTNTSINTDVDYAGLNSWEVVKGDGWGAVLAFMGDIYGSVQPFSLDLEQYSTLNVKLAATVDNTTVNVSFVTENGVQVEIPYTLTSSWSDISIDLAELPLDLNAISQIVIYGSGDTASEQFYVTDMNIAK